MGAKTLLYIASEYQIEDDAKKFLCEKLGLKEIEGQWYEEGLLNLAQLFKNSDGVVDLAGAQKLWKWAMDAGSVTDVEARTLKHIMGENKFAEDASEFLVGQLSLVSK